MNQDSFKQCTKTVMDNIADPNIVFDENGVSNYWYEYQEAGKENLIHGESGKKKWLDTVAQLKQEGKGKKYDCIIGVSGGVDSTYIAYLVKQADLRPLVVHFDNGWNSEIAVKNINKIIDYLDADLFTLVVDWEEFRDLQRAYLKAGVIDIEVLTDHAIFGTLYKLAAKNNIKYVLSGANVETEALLPSAWTYSKKDSINIKAIHTAFGKLKLNTYPFFSILARHYYLRFKKLNYISPINWAPYNKVQVKSLISKEIGWQDYGGKHHESIFTKFYQNYILPTKFNVDKRKAHLSNLICSGQMNRNDAIEEVKLELYNPLELSRDLEYVIKKLGFTQEEFSVLMQEPPRSHLDFEIEGPIHLHYPLLRPFKMLSKYKCYAI